MAGLNTTHHTAPQGWIPLETTLAIDLIVVLYNGVLRFLREASTAVEWGDVQARRAAVRRALNIIIYLQECLRMNAGDRAARALNEFYTSIFAQILQASESASQKGLQNAIQCVTSVRNAWQEATVDPGTHLTPDAASVKALI